jgi:hypothetical protein
MCSAFQGGHLLRGGRRNEDTAPEPVVALRATYDALGHRVQVKEGAAARRFVYDGASELAEYRNGTLSNSCRFSAATSDERIKRSANLTPSAHHRICEFGSSDSN